MSSSERSMPFFTPDIPTLSVHRLFSKSSKRMATNGKPQSSTKKSRSLARFVKRCASVVAQELMVGEPTPLKYVLRISYI